MFGAFRPTAAVSGGLLWSVYATPAINSLRTTITEICTFRKVPWRLSATRKANVRDRLKKVDAVIDAVRASGVQCTALVCPIRVYMSHPVISDACRIGQRSCLAQGARDGSQGQVHRLFPSSSRISQRYPQNTEVDSCKYNA